MIKNISNINNNLDVTRMIQERFTKTIFGSENIYLLK